MCWHSFGWNPKLPDSVKQTHLPTNFKIHKEDTNCSNHNLNNHVEIFHWRSCQRYFFSEFHENKTGKKERSFWKLNVSTVHNYFQCIWVWWGIISVCGKMRLSLTIKIFCLISCIFKSSSLCPYTHTHTHTPSGAESVAYPGKYLHSFLKPWLQSPELHTSGDVAHAKIPRTQWVVMGGLQLCRWEGRSYIGGRIVAS